MRASCHFAQAGGAKHAPWQARPSLRSTSICRALPDGKDKKDRFARVLETAAAKSSWVEQVQAQWGAPKPGSSGGAASSKTRMENERLKAELAAMRAREATSSRTRDQLALMIAQRAEERSKEVASMFAGSCATVEVAFLVDITASMGPYIKTVAKQVELVASEVARRFSQRGNRTVRFAFVGYRDYSDSPIVEQLDFTQDLAAFAGFVNGRRAGGGGDGGPIGGIGGPEDVFSGLEALGKLSWGPTGAGGVTNSKAIIHIGDTPCHGTHYHGGHIKAGDNFTSGDKLGRSAHQLLHTLRVDQGVQIYHFSHITEYTQLMVQRFKEECGEAGWVSEGKLGSELGRLSAQVVSATARSVASTFSARSANAATRRVVPRPYVIDKTLPSNLNWDVISAVRGQMTINVMPDSFASLLSIIDRKEGLAEFKVTTDFFLKLAPNPFSDTGALRLPYYCRGGKGAGALSLTDGAAVDLVAKVFRDGSASANLPGAYKAQMETQSVACFMAQEFNRLGAGNTLRYTTSGTWTCNSLIGSSGSSSGGTSKAAAAITSCNIEEMIEGGDIVKFNNNAGYVNVDAYEETLQAFSHWTFQATDGRLMVVDIQGLWDAAANEYVLIDPAIHCPSDPTRFTKTNLGTPGIETFFLTHKCSAKCRALGLHRHPAQVDEEDIARRAGTA